MPCYNHGAFIQEAVDSVLQQSYPNLELIIVDDASTDSRVHQIIKSLLKKDTRIKTIFLENNSGPAAARSSCIEGPAVDGRGREAVQKLKGEPAYAMHFVDA